MLVLSRRINESIMIGDDIEIIIISVSASGKEVRMGIIAPRQIEVHRKEIYQKIKKKVVDK